MRNIENGHVYALGSGHHGCLGIDSFHNSNLPSKLRSFDKNPIKKLSCGVKHVLAIPSNFQWCHH